LLDELSLLLVTTNVCCLSTCFLSLPAGGCKFELLLDSSCGFTSVAFLIAFYGSGFLTSPLLSMETPLLFSPK
jgi:hypothetical protein